MKQPVRVAVTGAAGQISYSLLFRIAAGDMLGKDQPVILQLLEITPALEALKGVVMELEDCAFPLLAGVVQTDDASVAFKDADYALLVGARPRGPGMERKDLLEANAAIFSAQGKALNDHASRDVKVLVVGNPANTNALIAQRNAPDLNPRNFTAMTRLDHNRGMAQLAEETETTVNDIKKMTIWGNHSSTQYPDLTFTTVQGKPALDLVDRDWYENTYLPKISPLALIGLLYTIVLLFSLQGDQILSQPWTVARVAVPLLTYFVGMFTIALIVTKATGMNYAQSASVSFTAAGNNFELAIAVAIGTFGATSAQALAGTIGPLIEIPVLVGLVYLMRGIGPKLFPGDPTLPNQRSLT